jgi:predicted amidohydrolase YtcJ
MSTTEPPKLAADLVFINGAVVTMNPADPNAEALAVSGDMILEVGSNQQILAYQGPNTNVIDLQGRVLLPGFVDAHTTFSTTTMHLV